MVIDFEDLRGIYTAIQFMDWEFATASGFSKSDYENLINLISSNFLKHNGHFEPLEIALSKLDVEKIERLFFYVSCPQHTNVKGTFLEKNSKKLYKKWDKYRCALT